MTLNLKQIVLVIFVCFFISSLVGFGFYAKKGSRVGEFIMWAGIASLLTFLVIITFMEKGSI